MNNKNVEEICGQYPEGFVKEDIASDPNFVFTNDTEYLGVIVYDEVGNSIIVNSFQECEHYVMGGWYENPIPNQEQSLQIGIVYLLIATVIIKFLIKKFVKL
tara:strand:+ start:3183 stop:3488 length:306 start_codon:yes stop_codon:yes gene_type:complete